MEALRYWLLTVLILGAGNVFAFEDVGPDGNCKNIGGKTYCYGYKGLDKQQTLTASVSDVLNALRGTAARPLSITDTFCSLTYIYKNNGGTRPRPYKAKITSDIKTKDGLYALEGDQEDSLAVTLAWKDGLRRRFRSFNAPTPIGRGRNNREPHVAGATYCGDNRAKKALRVIIPHAELREAKSLNYKGTFHIMSEDSELYTFDINLTLPSIVQISRLDDMEFDSNTPDKTALEYFCVYINGAPVTDQYKISASDGIANAKSFQLWSGGNALKYSVKLNDKSLVTPGKELTGQFGSDLFNCGGIDNASVEVTILNTPDNNSKPPGVYRGTLYLTVTPE